MAKGYIWVLKKFGGAEGGVGGNSLRQDLGRNSPYNITYSSWPKIN